MRVHVGCLKDFGSKYSKCESQSSHHFGGKFFQIISSQQQTGISIEFTEGWKPSLCFNLLWLNTTDSLSFSLSHTLSLFLLYTYTHPLSISRLNIPSHLRLDHFQIVLINVSKVETCSVSQSPRLPRRCCCCSSSSSWWCCCCSWGRARSRRWLGCWRCWCPG